MQARLDRHTTSSVADAAPRTLIVPLGSTEQHGPHLPLGTDSTIAEAWADSVASELPSAVVAPTLPYGSSGEHQGFPGTLSIGQEALQVVLVELARSAAHDVQMVVFLSGHAGNARPLAAAVAQLTAEGHSVHGFLPYLKGADAHAGHTETSIMLAIAADQVLLERAEPGNTQPLTEILTDLGAGRLAEVSPNGVLGDPRQARSEDGQRHLADLTRQVLSALAASADC